MPDPSAPRAVSGQFWAYAGECSWAPTEWQAMVDMMVTQLVPRSSDVPAGAEARELWNEVVARGPDTPAEERASVQALFYIRSTDHRGSQTEEAELRQLAQRNAAAFGGVPLLVADIH